MIDIQNLTYTYPGNTSPVIKDISLQLKKGEFVVILGANGSGKSTLLRCFNGLIQPNQGTIHIDGLTLQTPENIPHIRQKVGLVFQNPDDQIIASTVEREIAFGLENYATPPEEMHQRVNQALQQFHLEVYRKQDPNQLSGGERQRLALAAITVMAPQYLLLDEPTALLDPLSRQEILQYLYTLHKQDITTPILVTQIPSEAIHADRVIVLNQGQIILDDTPSAIFSQTDTLANIGLHPPLATQIAQNIALPAPLPLSIEALASRLQHPTKDTSRQSSDVPQTNTSPIISARNLCHIYNPKLPTQTTALNDLTIDIYSNEIAVLIGPSGSGKSTFIQHLNGLLRPTSGSLTVCDIHTQKQKNLAELCRRVGLIFQFPETQLFAETVFDDVAFGPQNLSLADIPTRVDNALKKVGLDPNAFLKRDPLHLSGGEKRRVAIAGVLAMEPDILVLDEPTAGLDPSGVHLIETLIHEQKKAGKTLIVITHDLDLAARIADRVYIFQHGQIAQHGLPAQMLSENTLTPHHLLPPETVQLASKLRQNNWQIPPNCITPTSLIAFLKGNSP